MEFATSRSDPHGLKFVDSLLTEFDREYHATREILCRVPDDKASFRPHPKSYAFGDLCLHVALLAGWMERVMSTTQFDLKPVEGEPIARPPFQSMADTLAVFDREWSRARAVLAGASEGEMLVMWSLKEAGRTLFTLPRAAVLRSWVFNHVVHHRGQLTVYLRLCDIPVPRVYGPTADSV
jgi:uncharacterized damage-inducible protein DinB